LEHEEEEEQQQEQEQQVPLNPSMAAAMAATQAAQAAAVAMIKARALINNHTVKGPGMEASIPSDPAQAKIEDEMCLVSAARDILDLPRVGRPPKGVAVDKALFSPTGVGFVLGSHLAAVLLFAGNTGPNAPTTFRGVGGKPNLMRRHRLVVLFSCRGVRYGIEMEQQEI
jgi:cell pole-organizing protein PopZ